MVEVSGAVPCALEAWEAAQVAVAVTAQRLTKVTPEGVAALEAEGATTETNSCGKFIRVHADSFQTDGHAYLLEGQPI